jgi:hypothetical protein
VTLNPMAVQTTTLGRGRSRTLRAPTIGITVGLLVWLLVFALSPGVSAGPSGRGMGGDLAVFLSASRVAQSGGDAYSPAAVYRAERSWLQAQHVPVFPRRGFIRAGNPPLLFWLLRPLAAVPFRLAAVLWLAFLLGAALSGLWLVLYALGWSSRSVPALLATASPPGLLALYYGNLDYIVLLAVGGALALRDRHPRLAGVLLTVGWLKPQLGIPAVLLVVLSSGTRAGARAASFAATSALLLLVTLVLTGPQSVTAWLGALSGYSDDITSQPDLASLSGLYVHSVGADSRSCIELLLVGLGLAGTVLWWRAGHDAWPQGAAWLWVAWFLLAPFAHFHDEIILAVPVFALLGRNGDALARSSAAAAVACLLLSGVLFPVDRFGLDLQCLGLLPLLVLALHQALRARLGPIPAEVPAGSCG